MQQKVPVVDSNQVPLMPTSAARADRWIKNGKATPFWKKGIFCIRLNVEPSARNYQPVACGIDPGSKMEGYTILTFPVKSENNGRVGFSSSHLLSISLSK